MNPCPMCGGRMTAPLPMNALSRTLRKGRPVYICSDCGAREAVADMAQAFADLPRFCYSDSLTERTVMILRGCPGYFNLGPSLADTPAAKLNHRWGVSDEVADRMTRLSVWDWDPVAVPHGSGVDA